MVSPLDIVSIYLCTCTSILLQDPRQGGWGKRFKTLQRSSSFAIWGFYLILKIKKKKIKNRLIKQTNEKTTKNPQSLQLGTTAENYMAINNNLQGGTAYAHRHKKQGNKYGNHHISSKNFHSAVLNVPRQRKKYSSISKHHISWGVGRK